MRDDEKVKRGIESRRNGNFEINDVSLETRRVRRLLRLARCAPWSICGGFVLVAFGGWGKGRQVVEEVAQAVTYENSALLQPPAFWRGA